MSINYIQILFPKDDDLLLDYLDEDGQSVEPAWYMPIIPMVLVNGSEGIGTGWSSIVPNYNPRDVENLRRLLNDEPMQPMKAWYRGFKGLIEKSAEKETGVTYTTLGIIKVHNNDLIITELPIHRWTADYNNFLGSLTGRNNLIMAKREYSDDAIVHFEVNLSEDGMAANQEGLDCSVLQEIFQLRLQFYKKRKKVFLNNLESDLLKLNNKVNFILGVANDEIIVNNRRRAELFHELYQKGLNPLPKKKKGIDVAIEGATTVDIDENEEESSETVKGVAVVKASDFEYLLSMSLESLTPEKVKELCADKQKIENKQEVLSTLPETLWQRDLDALEKQLDVCTSNNI